MCVLRITGEMLEAEHVLSTLALEPAAVFRRGESPPGSELVFPETALTYVVAEIDQRRDLEFQVERALKFLNEHGETLLRVSRLPGVERACLDFYGEASDAYVSTVSFPPALLQKLAACELMLDLTSYREG